jgi:hypothetical protein
MLHQLLQRLRPLPLAQAITAFYAAKATTRPKTQAFYQFHLQKFVAYHGGPRPLCAITPAHIDAYIVHLQQIPLATV